MNDTTPADYPELAPLVRRLNELPLHRATDVLAGLEQLLELAEEELRAEMVEALDEDEANQPHV